MKTRTFQAVWGQGGTRRGLWAGAARLAAAAAVVAGLLGPASANTVRDVTRLAGEGESVLQGLGLVVGLPGTGDGGRELTMVRPLAELLGRNGNPVASFEELRNSRSVALVMVTCVVPRGGAKVDDTLDVRVSVVNSATSLVGGELYISPMTAGRPGGQVYAFAQGPVIVETADIATTGVVPGGARVVRNVETTPAVAEAFDLILDSPYAGWAAATYIARTVNDAYLLTTDPLAEKIARVLDPRTVRVLVPEVEREYPAAFVADVLNTPITPAQLGVAAMVVANTKTGAIVVTGDVQLSPAVITHNDLVITTTIPAPVPTPETPVVERNRWAGVGEGARVQDLLTAFRQLDVPPMAQIQILQMLHKAGKLHGKLIVDGAES